MKYTDEYDADGRHIARTYGNYPADPYSWRDEYDAQGRHIACTWGNDPADPYSWRLEEGTNT